MGAWCGATADTDPLGPVHMHHRTSITRRRLMQTAPMIQLMLPPIPGTTVQGPISAYSALFDVAGASNRAAAAPMHSAVVETQGEGRAAEAREAYNGLGNHSLTNAGALKQVRADKLRERSIPPPPMPNVKNMIKNSDDLVKTALNIITKDFEVRRGTF